MRRKNNNKNPEKQQQQTLRNRLIKVSGAITPVLCLCLQILSTQKKKPQQTKRNKKQLKIM